MECFPHVPVLVEDIIAWLNPRSPGCYVDCTLGMGGTAYRLLEVSSPKSWLIGIDQDPEALAMAQQRLAPFAKRVRLICGNFRDVKNLVIQQHITKVNGIIFDLGVSSFQLDQESRGFSFLRNGPLDMRMSDATTTTAADLVNGFPQSRLSSLIYEWGEERYARRIAKAIAETRHHAPLSTTFDLVEVIRRAVPASYRHGRLHFATRTFQALRIAVNGELEVLEPALRDAADLLLPGARMGVVSFHSLEDRIVKHTFRAMAKADDSFLTVLTKKPLLASLEERRVNPRSRSAKLRVVERHA